ncbi:hypothetical protein FOL46_003399 [Perkinsus olseni]|uniref:Uncharacterized protein n=1 Tax=Perkinsus olseni TaxID=32597 RepID=A0A7J6MTN5_PEROL|nr:hypothetical protein FOL46_003399 [Perkinsus olseni]
MNVDVSPSPFQGGVNDITGLSGLATADGSGLTRYTSVCRVNLGDPVIVSERDREQSALGPDLLKYERKELLRASKRIKTKSASRAKQLALRTRAAAAAAAAAAKQQQPSGSNSNSTTAAVAQSSTVAKSSLHSKRTSGARMQHARMLERYGDLTRLSLETQSKLEDSDGKIQRLLKRRSALSEQRVQIDKEVTALQRRIREMVAAAMEAAAAATGEGPTAAQPPTTESEESQETASSSSSTPLQEPEVATAAAAPKPTHHVTANPHLNRARARLGRLAKRWQPTEDRDNKLEEDREEAERLLSQRQPSPKRKVRPPEISIEMASANVDDEGDGDEGGAGVEARESEEEDMEIMTEGDESEGEEDTVMDDATEADSGEEGSNGSSSSHHHDDDH